VHKQGANMREGNDREEEIIIMLLSHLLFYTDLGTKSSKHYYCLNDQDKQTYLLLLFIFE